MNKQQTVTINGVEYDAHTGLRVETTPETHESAAPQRAAGTASTTIHVNAKKSQTLSRKHVTTPHRQTVQQVEATPKPTSSKHPSVHRFSPHAPAKSSSDSADQLQSHPMHDAALAKHAEHKHTASQTHQPKPAHEQKHTAVEKALHSAKTDHNHGHTRKNVSRHGRFASLASASLAVVLLAGYFTYINLPNLSVRVAAAQAGIDASYPNYRPSGYSLDGPVAFADGQVDMKFSANVGAQNFNITQTKSEWDSAALLDNYISSTAGDNYTTYSDNGLTIYVYESNAAWVDGGILHTIQGDATLSPDQIRGIATSM